MKTPVAYQDSMSPQLQLPPCKASSASLASCLRQPRQVILRLHFVQPSSRRRPCCPGRHIHLLTAFSSWEVLQRVQLGIGLLVQMLHYPPWWLKEKLRRVASHQLRSVIDLRARRKLPQTWLVRPGRHVQVRSLWFGSLLLCCLQPLAPLTLPDGVVGRFALVALVKLLFQGQATRLIWRTPLTCGTNLQVETLLGERSRKGRCCGVPKGHAWRSTVHHRNRQAALLAASVPKA